MAEHAIGLDGRAWALAGAVLGPPWAQGAAADVSALHCRADRSR